MFHSVRKIWRRQQQGSAALITTIAVSAILVVLFVGITTIATREIRQSINADNANRALYAAEAGVEDAVRRLADDPRIREKNCNELAQPAGSEVPVTSSGTNNPDVAWTCRTITTLAAELTGRLDVDESLNLNLARGRVSEEEDADYVQPRYMTIEWNNPRDAADSATPVISKVSSWLPVYNPGVEDPWTGAAALEITSTWLQTTGGGEVVQVDTSSINKGGLNGIMPVRTVIASPACLGASCNYTDFSPWNTDAYPNPTFVDSAGVSQGSLKSNLTTRCEAGGSKQYSCGMPDLVGTKYDLANLVKTEINNGSTNVFYDGASSFDNTTMMLRIRPRYSAASYRIRFFDKYNNPVFMPDGNATIDVTARSGNYFRRVLAKKQLTPTIYDGVFDNALFSGSDICKNMRIYRDYRGAPDYKWDPATLTKEQNSEAGRNKCGSDLDV